ncbi:glycosyltransferase [Planktomarina temperata]|nr:glycosyltransferase [Planktomarina temperata]
MRIRTVSASIVLYQNPEGDLTSCLGSLEKTDVQTIYVIDNSPDERLKSVANSSSLVNYIHNPANPGYGAGHNIGMKKSLESGFQYHLVINADISFEGNIIRDIVEHLDVNTSVGALMPKVLYPNGEKQHLCKFIPSPYDLLARRFLPISLKEVNEKKFKMMDYNHSMILSVPYLSGCFMFLRNESISNIGLFDERFFMYPEDIDLSRRIAQKYETIYFPKVTVVHKHEEASRKSNFMLFVHIWNMMKYFQKWGWFSDRNRKILNCAAAEKNRGAKL